MADTSTIELQQMPDLHTPDTLIIKNTKANGEEDSYINNEKSQGEYIKQTTPKHRSFMKNFQQQTLPGWYFTPTIKCSLICTFFCWIVLMVIGIINVAITSNLIEHIYNYPDECQYNSSCILKMTFNDDIEGPVFFYYGIKYFYQNHRDYVKSISWDQIRGQSVSSSTLSTKCTDVQLMSDVTAETSYSFTGYLIESDQPASPCGLIAKSFFNDSYILKNVTNGSIIMENNNLVFANYRDSAFKREPNYHKNQYIDVQDEHFMVWTQFSSTAYWYKLWGRIPHTIPKGDYYLTIINNYNVSRFGGIKSINFSNSSIFGGKNRLLGGFLLVFAGIYFLGFIYILKNRNNFSRESDLNFDWKK